MATPTPPKPALTPSPKVAPNSTSNPLPVQADMGRASGVSTDTRVMTSGGPASVPLSVPTVADSASVEKMKRWLADEESLDTAAAAGYTVSRQQKEMRRRALNASNATVESGCQPSLDVYTSTSNQGGIKGSAVGSWICGMDDQIKFREAQYQNQINEFRLYIEGADVTNYVEGAISWTIESTGGMNSCRFTLNNTQDAFILMPENICAGLNPAGWRVAGQGRDDPGRDNWRVDETAKYIIYRNKYNAVDPEGVTPQIDQQTGMWLFPLNPYSCIFNRHDCVRLFVRLPHVSSVRATDKKAYDLWMPAFTGFIKDYSWDDNPVSGPRYVKITCYDYRGILERMRVAIAGAGLPSPNSESSSSLLNRAKELAKKEDATKPGEQNKGPSTYDFLIRASKLGAAWKKWFDTNKLGASLSKDNREHSKGGDPYAWALATKLIDAFIELYKSALSWTISKRNINDQPANASGPLAAGTVVAGKEVNPTDVRMGAAIKDANDLLDLMVCNVIEGIGQTLALEAKIASKTGVQYSIIMAGQSAGPGVPPRFDVQIVPSATKFKPAAGSTNHEAYREVPRQAMVQAYVKWAGVNSVNRPMNVVKVPAGCKTNCPPASIEAAVTQYFDIVIKGDASTYKKQAQLVNTAIVTMVSEFERLAQAYNQQSGALTKVDVFIPLKELLGASVWTSKDGMAQYGGTTNDAKVWAAVAKYIQHVIVMSEASRKALADESGKATPPTSDKDGTAMYYMARTVFTQDQQPNWPFIEGFRIKGVGPGFKPWPLNYASIQFGIEKAKYEEAIRKQSPSTGPRKLTQLKKAAEKVQAMHNTGPSRALAGANEVRTLGAIVKKFVEVDKAKVGIFGDLIKALEGGHPHPLAGKNFEQAIHFLCSDNSELDCGVMGTINSYSASKLDGWNRVALFGAVQRPLTFREMQEVGQATVRDFRSDFCPLKAFYHILLPENGVGVRSVVKMHIAGTNLSSPDEPTFTTRLQLLNEVCESLDYQFYVSGMGDLIFEVPVYNAYPDTFGPVFSGAYMISKDWVNSSISEENQDVPTAWVVTGSNVDLRSDQSTPKGSFGKAHFDKITIMNHTMIRRLGVKVETIPLKIPGLGQNLPLDGSSNNALEQLVVYASFYIQRQLARAHMLAVKYPFRPYVIPNRPLWLVPRQRIGLATSVTHTMNPPQGQCTTDSTIGYVRWMFRDGTFRFIGGGDRQPMDYVGMFRGSAGYSPTEGTPAEGPLSLANITPRLGKAEDSPSDLANRIRAANAFSSNVSASFAELNEPPTVQQITQAEALGALTVGTAIGTAAIANAQAAVAGASGTPGSSAAAPTGTLANASAGQKNKATAGASQQVSNAQNPPSTRPPPGTGSETSYNRTARPDLVGTGHSVDGIPQPVETRNSWQYLQSLGAWKAGEPTQGRFCNWGLLRSFNLGYYGEFARGKRLDHPGFDIMCRQGTALIAPIQFDQISAGMQIYTADSRNRKGMRSTDWSIISALNSTPFSGQYPVLLPNGAASLDSNGLAMTQTMYGLVNNMFFAKPFNPKKESQALAHAEYYDNFVCAKVNQATLPYCPKGYRSSKGAKHLKPVLGGACGLWFEARGFYTPPPDRAHLLGIQSGARVRILLTYIHMSRFAEDVVSDRGILGLDYLGRVDPGTVVGYVGNTGQSAEPHLHVKMYVMGPSSGTDENAFKAVAAANADYLTQQVTALATQWIPSQTPLSPETLNKPVTTAMLDQARQVLIRSSRARAVLGGSGAAKMTVGELVALYKSDPAIAKYFKDKTNLVTSARWEKNKRIEAQYAAMLQTNPMFFFTPDQLVDLRGVAGAVPLEPGGSGSGPASGSPGTAYPPLGKSPAYNGTSLQWCSGIMGNSTRQVATASAKSQQAAATAGKNTAANPQNKAAEDEKLKQTLAKTNAPIKESDASKAAALKNPEAVRRRINALSAKTRQSSGASPILGAGVSSDTGSKKK